MGGSGGRSNGGMPDHFVDSLRILFEILDPNRSGYISYQQLCARWTELPTPKLPRCFLDCLGSVTPPSGLITFEKFMTAVRRSLSEENLHRVQSEGRLTQQSVDKKRGGPTMGLNGLDRRSAYSSQPTMSNENGNYASVDYVQMRSKKDSPRVVQNGFQPSESRRSSYIRFRPVSTNSFASVASSGMTDVRWRNSHVSSSPSTASSQQTVHDPPLTGRHEALLEEEKEILNRGIDNGNRLLAWYNDRLSSVDKRSRLLNSGMVAMEIAVHEQRLNYLRAHVTELNRRIISLMESSDKGFPTHNNLQVRTQLPQPDDDRASYFQRQNKLLSKELDDKDKLIESLRQERLQAQSRAVPQRIQPQRTSVLNARPAAMVRPAPQQETIYKQTMRQHAPSPVKVHDTLM